MSSADLNIPTSERNQTTLSSPHLDDGENIEIIDNAQDRPEVIYSEEEEFELVPESERKLQDERLKLCQESLDGSRQQYEVWADKITRRRMFALSRLRKLQRIRRQRMKFYDELKLHLASERDTTSSMETNSVSS